MKIFCLVTLLFISGTVSAQTKKPLTHEVYDGWKSVGERVLSNNGRIAVYSINPQEGDGVLYINDLQTNRITEIKRGYGAVVSADSRFVFCKIRPRFQDTRQARIKKKKPDEMPKDSLAIIEAGTDSIVKISLIKSFRTPEKSGNWLAYHADKPMRDSIAKKSLPDSLKRKIDALVRMADSIIRKSLDSVKGNIEKEEMINAAKKAVKEIYKKAENDIDLLNALEDAEGDETPADKNAEGTDLILRNMISGKEKTFKQVNSYLFDKKGNRLLLSVSKSPKDSNSKAMVVVIDPVSNRADTIMKGFNETKNFVFDEEGDQLSFVAERDSSVKSLQKFYKLWYYNSGKDSAMVLTERNTPGIRKGFTVSENAALRFSKDGKKLFFGTAAILPVKDTTQVEFEQAKVDVWHYNDDYLQPQQLKQLPQELKRSYTAVYFPAENRMVQLGADTSENISLINEGNADIVLAQSTKGSRIASQWEGRSLTTAYLRNMRDGSVRLISSRALGNFQASPGGKYIYWYDPVKQNYFTYNTKTGAIKNTTEKIKVPLYDTENDVPDYPSAAGVSGWTADDKYFLINDEYDIWQTDPAGMEMPKNMTNGFGRKNKIEFRYVRTDTMKRFFEPNEKILLRSQNKMNKEGGIYTMRTGEAEDPFLLTAGPYSFSNPLKAKDNDRYLLMRSDVSTSELFVSDELKNLRQLTRVSDQQKDYNWLTAELIRWKMFDGKMSEGLLYKPENFDPKKKYPVIFYFYERDADGLYNYRTPAPSASTINIPYFVSNEYLVFDPNIYYKTGEPGQSAYNSVVSAAKYLSRMPWVDSTRMAIQGQSWGGYQVAYLITRTNIFRAAGAGAPVSNMTSAYGGIRWGPGINRQFQYEKQQSRIGATLWQRPDLYIKNSPLFAADKINTPLLIMHNDADGAVPWYQGIELFTAMKRLGKPVWMLQYNGEDHNLVERKNRKDLSVRLSQFFDYHLKDKRPADWIRYGVPATQKGIDKGLNVSEEKPKVE